MKVFVSYAQSDKENLKRLRTKLSSALTKSLPDKSPTEFFDAASQVAPGENIREMIQAAVRDCNYFVVYWTPHAAASDWVQYEVAMADALKKQIVVVKEPGAH